MFTRFRLIVLLSAAILLWPARTIQAGHLTLHDALAPQVNPGGLDPSFGGFGVAGTISNVPIDIRALALQADGKIVVAGKKDNTFALARYHPDGKLDTAFGSGGIVTTTIHSTQSDAEVFAVAIQPNGKIVAAGYVMLSGSANFALARYNSNGSLDVSFSGDGKVQSDFDNDSDQAEAVAIQSDGKIVAAGFAKIGGDYDFAVERFNTDGTLDTSFSGNGKSTVGFGNDDLAFALTIQPNGKLLIAGRHLSCGLFNCDQDFALARLNSDGSLDTTFDGDGKLTTGLGGNDSASGIALQSDGRIVAAGNSDAGFALTRYLSNGALDATFDGDGKLTMSTPGALVNAQAVVIQPDGKIVAAGTGQGEFALVRYNPDGTLDTAFDSDGVVLTDVSPSTEHAFALALQPDGRLVAAGEDCLARYFPDGSLDEGGWVMTNFDIGDDRAFAVTTMPDGRIIAAGQAEAAQNGLQVALARYWPDGTPDLNFGDHGEVLAGFQNDDAARAVALTPDGKLVAAGFREDHDFDFAVWRFNADGTPDASFNLLGFNVADFGLGDDFGQAVLMQSDEKIVVAGLVASPTSVDPNRRLFGLARFNTNGALDRSFGSDGWAFADVGSGFVSARAAILQPDGEILVAGGHAGNFVVARFTAAGALDNTFGGDGIVEINLPGNDEARALSLVSNGTIAIGGYSSGDFGLAFLNSNGSVCTCGSITGLFHVDFGGDESVYAIVLQPDGRVLLAGGSNGDNPAASQFYLARFRRSLTSFGYALDTSFGNSGKVSTPISAKAVARAMTLDTLDRIVVAGYSDNGNDDFALARYLSGLVPQGGHKSYLPVIVK